MLLGLLLATLTPQAATAPSADVEGATRFEQARENLAGHVTPDGFEIDASPAAIAALHEQWSAAQTLIGQLLDRGLAPPVLIGQARAAGLGLNVIPLDAATLLVSATSGRFGTVYLFHHDGDGHFRPALAFDAPYVPGGGMRALAAWQPAQAGRGCQGAGRAWDECGPMNAFRLLALPNERSGARRFAVIGAYVKSVGGTIPYQVSIWRWDGRTATPLSVRTFAQALEEPVFVGQDPHGFTLRVRQEYVAFPACGECSGRQMTWRFDLPPTGAAAPRTQSLSPELDLVDRLYDRRAHHLPAADLAAPAVIARVDHSEADMLGHWRLLGGADAAARRLCLDADGFDSPQIFRIVRHNGKPWIAGVTSTAPHACDGPGSRD